MEPLAEKSSKRVEGRGRKSLKTSDQKRGEPGRGRTDNLRIRSPLLYPIGLRARGAILAWALGKLGRLGKYEVNGLPVRRRAPFPTALWAPRRVRWPFCKLANQLEGASGAKARQRGKLFITAKAVTHNDSHARKF